MATSDYYSALGLGLDAGGGGGPYAPPPPTGTMAGPPILPGTNFGAMPQPPPTFNPFGSAAPVVDSAQAPVAPPQPAPQPLPAPKPPMTAMMGGPVQLRPDFNGEFAPTPGPFDTSFRVLSRGGTVPAQEMPTRGPTATSLLHQATQIQQAGVGAASEMRQQQAVGEQAYAYDVQAKAENHAALLEAANARNQTLIEAARKAHTDEVSGISRGIQQDEGDKGAAAFGQAFAILLMAAPYGISRAGGLLSQVIDKNMDRDLEVRRFNYNAGLNRERGAQAAYDNAIRQAGSIQAGESMYRAAQHDAVSAAAARFAAENKGTEAAAHAAELGAQYEAQGKAEDARGFAYKQAQAVAPSIGVSIGGRELPFGVSPEKANQIQLERGIAPTQSLAVDWAKTGMDITKEQSKEAAAAKKTQDALFVEPTTITTDAAGNPIKLPGYQAKTETEAKELRDSRAAGAVVLASIDKIKKIRAEEGTVGRALNRGGVVGAYNPDWMTKVQSERAAMMPALNELAKIKRLSEADISHILEPMTDKAMSVGSSGDVQADASRDLVLRRLGYQEESSTGKSPRDKPVAAPAAAGKDQW